MTSHFTFKEWGDEFCATEHDLVAYHTSTGGPSLFADFSLGVFVILKNITEN